MKKLIFSLSLFLSISSLATAQWALNGTNIYNTNGGNVGIGTQTPSNYFHGGNNKVLEIFNPNTVINSQSHIILSTGAMVDGSSGGTLTWVSKNSTGVQGMAYIGSILQGDATTNAAGKIVFATSNGSVLSQKMLIDKDGNVGIGTTNPQTSLHVVSTGATYEADNSKPISGGGLVIQGNIGGSRSAATGAQLEFVLPANPDGSNFWGQARIITVPGTSSPGAFGKMILGTRRNINKFGTGYQLYYGDDLIIDGAGNIGIGIINPKNKLDVNGIIHSRAVNIDLTGWNDYVFKKDYQLKPLSEVKAYIDQNQHLPEIPSEQEMIKNGLDVGEMNKLLMKKVEELTLYLIEKDKEKKEQQQTNEDLKKQLKDQQIRLDELSRLLKPSSN